MNTIIHYIYVLVKLVGSLVRLFVYLFICLFVFVYVCPDFMKVIQLQWSMFIISKNITLLATAFR